MKKAETLYPIQNAYRNYTSLDGLWYMAIGKEEGYLNGLPKRRTLVVPSNARDMLMGYEEYTTTEPLWLEQTAFVPTSWLGQDVFLRLERVQQRYALYVNGILVSKVEAHTQAEAFMVTRHIRYGEINRFLLLLEGEPLDRMWGITGSVHLYHVPQTRISQIQAKVSHLTTEEAHIDYEVEAFGNCLITVTLRDPEGKVVATAVGGQSTLHVQNPIFWEMESPYRYTLEVEASRLGKHVDAYVTSLPLRTLEVSEGKLLLNGKQRTYSLALWESLDISSHTELAGMQQKIEEIKAKGYMGVLVRDMAVSHLQRELLQRAGLVVMQALEAGATVITSLSDGTVWMDTEPTLQALDTETIKGDMLACCVSKDMLGDYTFTKFLRHYKELIAKYPKKVCFIILPEESMKELPPLLQKDVQERLMTLCKQESQIAGWAFPA